jgi:SAM-dependent methyltransferase
VALAERGAKVWGVDPSEEQLAAARARGGRLVPFRRAAAEALPFKDGWFERAIMRLVGHHVDRRRAIPELARVLAPRGRAAIATFRPEPFERFWLAPSFPSIPALDARRFPRPDRLAGELRAAGFASVRETALSQRVTSSRSEALERIRGRFISTLRLVSEAEYDAGLTRAEAELADPVSYTLEWSILVGEKPA